MKRLAALVLLSLGLSRLFADDGVTGYWKTMDPDLNIILTIMAAYEYEDKLYGQLIVNFDEKTGKLVDTIHSPVQHVADDPAKPYLCRTSLFWDLKYSNNRWKGGKIMDPRNGWVFDAQVWRKGDLLVLKGSLGLFGGEQNFYMVNPEDLPEGFVLPPLDSLRPSIANR